MAGAIPFLGAILFTWFLLIRVTRKLNHLPATHKHLVIQSGAVLAFLTMRALPESTGAFFGVDWLLLGPILLYFQVVHSRFAKTEVTSQ